jgi:hypothetical protein
VVELIRTRVDLQHTEGDALAVGAGPVEELADESAADASPLVVGRQFDEREEDLVIALLDVELPASTPSTTMTQTRSRTRCPAR